MRIRPEGRAASGRTAASSSTRSDCARLQGRSHRDRRHRGEPAPHRAFRLLVGPGAALGIGRLQSGSSGLRQRGAADRRDCAAARLRASDRATSPICAAPPICARSRRADGIGSTIDSSELDAPEARARPPADPYAPGEEDRARARRSRRRSPARSRARRPTRPPGGEILSQGAERRARAQRHPAAPPSSR